MSELEIPAPDDEEGYLYVREMETDELFQNFNEALDVAVAMAEEIDHRREGGPPEDGDELTDDALELLSIQPHRPWNQQLNWPEDFVETTDSLQ